MGIVPSSFAAPAFNPLAISGLALGLAADLLSNSADDPISSWSDFSGNGNTATGSLTARPTYKTNVINSLPVARFDGSNDFLTIARNSGLEPTAATWFAVVRADTSPGNFRYFASKKHTAQDTGSYGLNTSGAGLARAVCATATTGAVASGTEDIFDGNAHILTGCANGTTLRMWVDGHIRSSVTAVGNLIYDSNDLYLGSFDGSQLFAAFDLGEFLLYNTALSAANRWKVLGYLGNKWAVP